MIWTITFIIIAAAPALYRAAYGWRNGASTEMRHVITYLFALLVAVRFWEPLADLLQKGLNFDLRFIAIGAYALLFAAGAVAAGVAVRIKSQAYRSVSADFLNQGLGLLAGAFSGSLLGGSLALLLGIAIPTRVTEADSAIVNALIKWPQTLTAAVESGLAGVPRGSDSAIRFPVIIFSEVPVAPDTAEAGAAEPGTAVMQLQPALSWE